jgi:predicted TIM-barrel fold metal-dependent hydrolase
MNLGQATAKPDEIFDAHVHVWPRDRVTDPPINLPGSPLPDFDGAVEHLLRLMDANGVGRALLVQTPWYGENNNYLIHSIQVHRDRFAGLGYLPDPLASRAPYALRKQFDEEGLRGVRLHLLQPEIVKAVVAGNAARLLRAAAELRVPVQLLYRDQNLHGLIGRLAQQHPNLTLVIDHLGHVDPNPQAHPGAWETLLGLAKHPTIYVKVSLHYRLSRDSYPWRDLHPFQEKLLAAFGASRLMWGSNFPMHLPQPAYAERLAAVAKGLPFLSATDRAWIMGKTALSLWGPN